MARRCVSLDCGPLLRAAEAIDRARRDGRIDAETVRRLNARLRAYRPGTDPAGLLVEVVSEPAAGGGVVLVALPGRDLLALLARGAPIEPRRWPAGPWG